MTIMIRIKNSVISKLSYYLFIDLYNIQVSEVGKYFVNLKRFNDFYRGYAKTDKSSKSTNESTLPNVSARVIFENWLSILLFWYDNYNFLYKSAKIVIF